MRRNWFIGLLFTILAVVVSAKVWAQFGAPRFSSAQSASSSNIGPHAAFFDQQSNINIASMVKSKSSANLPITVMLDSGYIITLSQVSDDLAVAEINNLLSATNGLTPIVRIVDIDATTPREKVIKFAELLNRSNIASGTLVVLGNELNNLDKEWKSCSTACPGQEGAAGAQYGALFNFFKGAVDTSKYTPVPAPPDMYNSVYDWQAFVNGANVYYGTLVANVYELPDGGGAGLDLYKQLPGTVIAFTEYGPHPSKSLQEHVDFLDNATLPSGIRFATTLIPNKCDPNYELGTDSYIYYVEGDLYDKDGNKIDPADCDFESVEIPDGIYKRFVYPFFSNTGDQNRDKKIMMNQLVEDYDVSCVPRAEYEVVLEGEGSISDLIKYAGCDDTLNGEACRFDASAQYDVTSEGASKIFGVLRNELQAKQRAYEASLLLWLV